MRQHSRVPFDANLVDITIFLLDITAQVAAKVYWGVKLRVFDWRMARATWRARHGGRP